ncbi:T9SS type A sorting domain-containing protein [Taibaiella helva]|uniref:T9SS type A sorting domain-containing protein n=1 Tax=Taibaiella helva TaxID=2301235 RepID=UPI000E582913|nr:T9SS type A sorting domain-containing protein [Taibaiella helva]
MNKKLLLLLAGACSLVNMHAQTQPFTELFCPVDTSFAGDSLVVPQSPLKYSILLREGDLAHNLEKSNSAPVKGGFGALAYDSKNITQFSANGINTSIEGDLYLSLRDNKTGITGNGGGYLKMHVQKNSDDTWSVVPQSPGGNNINYRMYDIDGLGGSFGNNGLHIGAQTTSSENEKGNLFLYESLAAGNADLQPGITETGSYALPAGSVEGGPAAIERYQNMGWLLEADRTTGKIVRKLYAAGRADIGGMLAQSTKNDLSVPAADNIDIIYTTQTQPAVLLRYNHSEKGIYAFKQDENSNEGDWLLLNEKDVDGSLFPIDFTQLLDIRKLALQKGATMFNRLGNLVKAERTDGLHYMLAETGGEDAGESFTNPALTFGGKLAQHLKPRLQGAKLFDPYGRILDLSKDMNTGKWTIKVHIEGGISMDGRYIFSNPKQISNLGFSYFDFNTFENVQKNYLLMNEEVPNAGYRRNPAQVYDEDSLINEVYVLDLDKTNPDPSSLRPFAIAPRGAEIQSVFGYNAEFSPVFLSIRYPNSTNSTYNRSLVIAVSNLEAYFENPSSCGWVAPPPGYDPETGNPVTPPVSINDPRATLPFFEVWPNPVSRTLFFSARQQHVWLYDVRGVLQKRASQVKELNIADLVRGTYFLQNDKGQQKKIIIQ